MPKKMLIDATHAEETRVVVVDGNKVDEFDFESENKRQLAGNIYLAKVTRVEPSLQAAFVDYGGNRHGFLAFSEIHPDYYQIPVADREALMAEELAYAEADAAQDDAAAGLASDESAAEPDTAKADKPRRSRSRSRSRTRGSRSTEAMSEADANGGPATAPETQIPGMEMVDPADDDMAASGASGDEAVMPPATEPTYNPAVPVAGGDAPDGAEMGAVPAAADDGAAGPAEGHEPSDTVRSEHTPGAGADVAAAAGDDPESEPAAAGRVSDDVSSDDDADEKSSPRSIAAARVSDDPVVQEEAAVPEDGEEQTGPAADRDDEDLPASNARAGVSSDEADAAADDTGMAEDDDGEGPDADADGGNDIESVADDDSPEDIRPVRRARPRRYKIQEVVKVRQIMLVQVVKEERGNKGAALTTYLSLAGRYCVLMPNTARGGGISRKITNVADRKKLKEIASELDVPKGAGLIVRTAGAKRTKAEIKRDYEYLQRLWEQIRELTLKSIAPAKIYEEGDLIKRSIRDLYNRDIDEVLVEGEAGYRTAKDFMRMIMPSHAKNVKHYAEPMPLFAKYQVESTLSDMFNPTVKLKSGGYIVIGVTEALVAIDVNSGKSTKEGSIEETALKTNLEAAEEVARQMRLRDLAGLIVIDFIDMDERRNNAAVEKRLKERLKTDRARIQVGRISGFGLLEMSRQRLRPGMIEATTKPCPHCHGTGLIRSNDNLALAILREVEEEGVRNRSREVLVKAPIDIANYLINEKREHIARIEARYGMAVRIEADIGLVSPNFTVEKFKTATRRVEQIAPVVSVDLAQMPDIDEDESAEPETDASAVAETPEPTQASHLKEDDGGKPKKKRRRRRRKKSGPDQERDGSAVSTSGESGGSDAAASGMQPAAMPSDDERAGAGAPTQDTIIASEGSQEAATPDPQGSDRAASQVAEPVISTSEPVAPDAGAVGTSAPVAEQAGHAAVGGDVATAPEVSVADELTVAAAAAEDTQTPSADEAGQTKLPRPDLPDQANGYPHAANAEPDEAAIGAPRAEPHSDEIADTTVSGSPETARKPKRRGWWSAGF